MGAWGFVGLAYGIVWGVILLYLISLKRRYNSAQAELDALSSMEATDRHVKK
jgi:CcmD family protein